MKWFCLICVFGCLAASPATLPTTAPSGLDPNLWARMKQVDARAAGIADLTADFQQRKFTPLLKKPMTSTGTVLARGDLMLWDTRAPEPTLMRVDANQIQVYYPKQKTLEVYPLAGRLAELARSPVPRLATLLDYFSFTPATADDVPEAGAPDRLALRMMPTDKTIAEHVEHVSVLIDSAHGFILALNVIDPDGERTEIRFSNVKTNTKLDDARLELKLPDGVRTVHPLEGLEPPPPPHSSPAPR